MEPQEQKPSPYLLPPIPGAERIRALKDEDAIYNAFDAYPWRKDRMFMSALYALLGDPNAEDQKGSPSEMAHHARIFYYAQRLGVMIDFSKYKDWLSRNPEHSPPNVLPEEFASPARGAPSAAKENQSPSSSALPSQTKAAAMFELTSKMKDLSSTNRDITSQGEELASSTPAWQASAPKAELYVERKNGPQVDGANSEDWQDQPNYPMGFAQMLEMLQKGIPIPGIREIADTVVRDPSIKPIGTRSLPRKPWEKEAAARDQDCEIKPTSLLDQEFPPLENDSKLDSAISLSE